MPVVKGPPPTMTAAGVLSRRLLGATRTNNMVRKGGKLCFKALPAWNSQRYDRDMYYWYVGSMALYRLDERSWQRWREATLGVLTQRQHKSGLERGSWDPSGVWGRYGGRVYSTAILADTLLVLGE